MRDHGGIIIGSALMKNPKKTLIQKKTRVRTRKKKMRKRPIKIPKKKEVKLLKRKRKNILKKKMNYHGLAVNGLGILLSEF